MRFEKSSSIWFLHYSEVYLLFTGKKKFLKRQDQEATGNGKEMYLKWVSLDTHLGLGRLVGSVSTA